MSVARKVIEVDVAVWAEVSIEADDDAELSGGTECSHADACCCSSALSTSLSLLPVAVILRELLLAPLCLIAYGTIEAQQGLESDTRGLYSPFARASNKRRPEVNDALFMRIVSLLVAVVGGFMGEFMGLGSPTQGRRSHSRARSSWVLIALNLFQGCQLIVTAKGKHYWIDYRPLGGTSVS